MSEYPQMLKEYILKQIDNFKKESKRLRTPAPLIQYKEIIEIFNTIQKTIGTIQHEVALDAVKKEFKHARREALSDIGASWRDFWTTRRQANDLRRQEQEAKLWEQELLSEMEQLSAEIRAKDSPLAECTEAMMVSARDTSRFELDLSPLWKKYSWVQLWVNAKILSICIQYMFHRFRVFLTYHGFILALPILVFGIGYSVLHKALTVYLVGSGFMLPWLAACITFVAYVFKRYYLDKKLKKLQVRLETRLFRPLSVRLLIARTVSLQNRTIRRVR